MSLNAIYLLNNIIKITSGQEQYVFHQKLRSPLIILFRKLSTTLVTIN